MGSKAPKTPTGLTAKWKQSRRLIRLRLPGQELDRDEAADLEADVLRGRIRSMDDVLAKLRAIELAFVDGERTDGADKLALRQTIRWLKTQHAEGRVRSGRAA
jgi:hypothetical protein